MEMDKESLAGLRRALEHLEEGFAGLPPARAASLDGRAREVLLETAGRLRDNYPYFHPLYAGQMLKPPHPLARAAYQLAMWINPNNHALDGGRATSAMEKEAVAQMAAMLGWQEHLGHLAGGGTLANLEALWAAGRLAPGRILASDQAHYTHGRLCQVLGLEFAQVPSDRRGRMDPDALEAMLAQGGAGTVVATAGTTGAGAVDPLPAICELQGRHGFRLHVDAAYGGYFALAGDLAAETRAALELMGRADSVVIDPHKHGLQPYGCGCVLFRDPAVGRLYQHDSPYTYFTSDELHLGEISLECSRPGAAAAALWATLRLLPLEPGGEFARGLERCRRAAAELHRRLEADPAWLTLAPPELDILVWLPAAASASRASALSRAVFHQAARRELHLALVSLPAERAAQWRPELAMDQEQVVCLRSCLLKPEHLDWLEEIHSRLGQALAAARKG
jgi:glutamate/tyrosine decarboxylase-like PLP-dependent enzyme